MLRLSSRSLLILAWILSIFLIQSVQPTPTHSLAHSPPTPPLTLITVTTAADEFALNNTCSLREAVYAAVHDVAVDACAAGAANDSISLPAATYTLTRTGEFEDGGLTGDLDITGTLQLTGATSATTIIDGNQTDRIFDIFSGNVTLTHLTLRKGAADNEGGAVKLRSGTLTADQTWFDHNTVRNFFGTATLGGAIYNSAGSLTLKASLFSFNHASSAYMNNPGFGDVLYNKANASTAIVDSTFRDSFNRYDGNGISNSGYLSISRSTFTHSLNPIRNYGTALIEASRFLTNTAPTIRNYGQLTINDSEIAFTQIQQDAFYCIYGGGILNRGSADINRTYIHDNVTEYGAGVASFGSTHIRDSAIVRNTAPNLLRGRDDCSSTGGGIYAPEGTLSIENSTIASNRATYTGGGLASISASTLIANTTIVSNYASIYHSVVPENPSHPDAGGIFTYSPITITNSLVAHNSSRLSPDSSDCHGKLVSTNSMILAPTARCTITATASLIGVEPLLGTLADHGGNTLTYNLLPGSPAIDAGSLNGCPDHDQRGIYRPQDGDGVNGSQCDIGAYEYLNPDTAVTATPTTPPTATTLPTATLTATATPTATTQPTAVPTVTEIPTNQQYSVYLPHLRK
ncbi:MAG: CSLREA domain-containing protein [Herpetosiphonaceae bacterium]|nr:CSLREA domain-containing protein [Herpetosiphonaceae bacterium]